MNIFVKDEFHYIAETKWSIKSLPVIDYVVVDSRADWCKPTVHFGSTADIIIHHGSYMAGGVRTTFIVYLSSSGIQWMNDWGISE